MPELSPQEQERILESLVQQELVTPEQAEEIRSLHQGRVQQGVPSSGVLDVVLERRYVTRRVVDEVVRARQYRARQQHSRVSALFWTVLAALLIGGAFFALQRTGFFARHEPPPPEVRRLHSIDGPLSDEQKAYEAQKRRQAELARMRRTEIDAWETAHQAESEIRLEVERRKEAEEAARRAGEEKRKQEEAEAQKRADEAARSEAYQKALAEATAEYERFIPEIENYVHFFAYAKALTEYEKYRETLKFDELKKRLDVRVGEIRQLDSLLARLRTAINAHRLTDDKITYGEGEKKEAVITSATDDYYEVTFPGGTLRMRWAYLRPTDLHELYGRLDLSPAELVTLGIFCYESELPYPANSAFVAAIAKDPSVKPTLDRYVADKRGIPVPPGGFIPYQGLLVTAEERDNYEKGLIKCGTIWIRPEEIVYVQKGWVKQDGKWIPRNEAELLAKGFKKYKGKWYTPEELALVRKNWDDAWELDTEHYHIRSNTTEAWTKELGDCLEQAYLFYKEHFAGEPKKGKPMEVYAFRSFEDYRNFCIAQKAENLIPAGGHTNAFKNYASGYSKSGDKELLNTMLHEGAHLFYGRTWGDLSPSWWHEGMATYFEGFTWDKKKLAFHHVSGYRLPWVKQAFQKGQYLPLAELLQGDAISAIQKGARESTLFYAEAWALYYWLNTSGDPELKKKFDDLALKYRTRAFGDSVMKPDGALASFTGVFGADLAALETRWKAFVLGVQPK